MADIKILQRKTLLDGFMQIEELTIQRRRFDDTITRPLVRYILHRPDAACAIVKHVGRGTLLFVKQFRIAAHGQDDADILELAAGLCDDGESAEQAIKREVLEELGYRIQSAELLHRYYPSPGINTERVSVFYAEVSDANKIGDGGGVADEEEDIQILEYPVDEIENLLTSGKIIDGKTLIGLYAFLHHLKS